MAAQPEKETYDEKISSGSMLQEIAEAVLQGVKEIVTEPLMPTMVARDQVEEGKETKKDEMQATTNNSSKKEKKKKQAMNGKKEKNKMTKKKKKKNKHVDTSSSSSSSSSESEDDSHEGKVKNLIWLGIFGGLVLTIVGLIKQANTCKVKSGIQTQKLEGGRQVECDQKKESESQITIVDLREKK